MQAVNNPPRQLFYGANDYLAYHTTPGTSPGVLFFGGFHSDMEGTKALFLEDVCKKMGVAFARFDYAAHGESSGDILDCTIDTWVQNSILALDSITLGKQILIGSSMGGWMMLHAALARPQRVAGLIGIAAAPDFTEDLIWNILDDNQKQEILQKGVYNLPTNYCNNPGTPESEQYYPITRRLIEEGRNHLLLRGGIPITCPVRLLHGKQDNDVPYETSMKLASHLTSTNKKVRLLEFGDHRMSSPEALELLRQSLEEMLEIARVRE